MIDKENAVRTKLSPGLYIVPTPVGNLEDITKRAIQILSTADVIACEDTRTTGKLLKLLGINARKFESYHEHNERQKAQHIINYINNDMSVALVTDAGTPGISDPGYRLVQEAIENEVPVFSLPGPTAMIPALVASGMPTNKFKFFGFPPHKKGRKSFFEEIAQENCTSIIYESPYRIIKLVEELITYCGRERRACLAREISKIHEEYIRGPLEKCRDILQSKPAIKGEFVVILEGVVKGE
jgi:16S rRNA (cytidine1402-2'-O)-methyltransferase